MYLKMQEYHCHPDLQEQVNVQAGQFNKVYQMLEITLSKAETHKVNNKEQNP